MYVCVYKFLNVCVFFCLASVSFPTLLAARPPFKFCDFLRPPGRMSVILLPAKHVNAAC